MLLPLLIDPHVHWSAGSLSPPSSPDSSFYKPSDFIHLPTSDSFSFFSTFQSWPQNYLSPSIPSSLMSIPIWCSPPSKGELFLLLPSECSYTQLLIWILRARFNDLATQYEAAFGTQPKYIARAPGRVKYVTVRLYPAFP